MSLHPSRDEGLQVECARMRWGIVGLAVVVSLAGCHRAEPTPSATDETAAAPHGSPVPTNERLGEAILTTLHSEERKLAAYELHSDGSARPVTPSPFPQGAEEVIDAQPSGPFLYEGKSIFGSVQLDETGHGTPTPLPRREKEWPSLLIQSPLVLLWPDNSTDPRQLATAPGVVPRARVSLPARSSIRKTATSRNWAAISLQGKDSGLMLLRFNNGALASSRIVPFKTVAPDTAKSGDLSDIVESFALQACDTNSTSALLAVTDMVLEEDSQVRLFRVDDQSVTSLGTVNAGYRPDRMSFSPDGKLGFVMSRTGQMTSCRIGTSSVELADRFPVDEADAGETVEVGSSSPYVLTTNNAGDVVAYRYDTQGKLSGPVHFRSLSAEMKTPSNQYWIWALR